MSNTPKINIMFDMRAPDFGATISDLYTAALDMAAFCDEMGVYSINVMEHHGSDDGYLPSPFVLAGGMAARTKQARILLGAVILPLHDPVKIAEQIAILDIMSKGRVEIVFGAGYVPSEFAMFEVSLRDRGRLLNEGIDVILRALRGERFEHEGRPIYVRPLPIQAPEDIIMVGGGVEASAKRAARFGVGFAPMQPGLMPIYEEACRELGRSPGKKWEPSAALPLSIHLAEDPEAGWKLIEPHALHIVSEYAKWADQEANSHSPFKDLHDAAALRASGLFAVWTPEELIARVSNLEANSRLGLMPLLGGLPPEHGWSSLKLLQQCLPDLRKHQQQAG